MGNRAVITTQDKEIGVYLHWNGGRDSVEAFLAYCKLKGYRPPEVDCYGWARLCQVIGNFFGGEFSIGIDAYNRVDTNNGNNGVYVIDKWEVVGRLNFDLPEQLEYNLKDMLLDINDAQPKKEQLPQPTIEKFISDLKRDGYSIINNDMYFCSPELIKEL